MTLYTVIEVPDPRLRVKCAPVVEVDDSVREILDRMLATMYAGNGVGLAAPQVGLNQRLVVVNVDYTDENPGTVYKLVNPEILWRSEELIPYQEGCLSVPEFYPEILRPARVRVRYLDENRTFQELEADSVLSRCFQHEIDHLDGILNIDYLSQLKRDKILNRLKKIKRLSR